MNARKTQPVHDDEERCLRVDARLELPPLDPNSRLHAVLRAAVKAPVDEQTAPHDGPLFGPRHFGFDKVRVFNAASERERRATLLAASRAQLVEAFFIEQLGVAFCAKMILLSETRDERTLYGLMAGDEARHLLGVARYLDEPDAVRTESPFHALLAELIETGDKTTLTFVIQVVLEGWGLTHYRALADDCRSAGLTAVLRAIVEDEARHHGAGKVLFDERGLGADSARACDAVLGRFLGLVRAGPQAALEALDQCLGGLSPAQRRAAFDELGGQGHARERLALLERLMTTSNSRALVNGLRSRGMFEPAPVAECV